MKTFSEYVSDQNITHPSPDGKPWKHFLQALEKHRKTCSISHLANLTNGDGHIYCPCGWSTRDDIYKHNEYVSDQPSELSLAFKHLMIGIRGRVRSILSSYPDAFFVIEKSKADGKIVLYGNVKQTNNRHWLEEFSGWAEAQAAAEDIKKTIPNVNITVNAPPTFEPDWTTK